MPSGKGQTRANNVLSWLLRNTTDAPASPTEANIKVALTKTTNPSATSPATGNDTGSGYTAGGTAAAFSAPSAGATAGPTAGNITWTNTGTQWVITGLIIHDASSGHPLAANMIFFDDAFDVTVDNGVTLQIDQNGIDITET